MITGERFIQMSAGYEREQAELNVANAALRVELDTFSADSDKGEKFVELVRRYTNFETLTNAMLNEFIEKIYVHEGNWSEKNTKDENKGTRRQRIDVYLRYIGKFDVPDTRTPEEIEAERIAEEKLIKERECKRRYMRRKYAEAKAEKTVVAL